MRQPTKRARRFRIETLEPRNLLAFGAGEPVLSLPDGNPNDVAETAVVAQPHTLLSREAFLERGFRGVDSSDARPEWSLSFHNNPERWYQAAGAGTQSFVIAPASYNTGPEQGAIVMLRALQTHEPVFVVAIHDFDERMIIHTDGDRLEQPVTLSSPGSQPLPLFADTGSTVEPEGEADQTLGDTEPAINSESTATFAGVPIEFESADTEAIIDQAIAELSRVSDALPALSAQTASNDAGRLGIEFWSDTQRPSHDHPPFEWLLSERESQDTRSVVEDGDYNQTTRTVVQHQYEDHGRYSSRWLMQYLDPADVLSAAAQTDMHTLEDMGSWGSALPGVYLKQIFVGVDTNDTNLEADSDRTSPMTVLAASSLAVITAATVIDRRRSRMPVSVDKTSI